MRLDGGDGDSPEAHPRPGACRLVSQVAAAVGAVAVGGGVRFDVDGVCCLSGESMSVGYGPTSTVDGDR